MSKLIGGRGFKKIADAMLSFVSISPQEIPLTRNGKSIVFNRFVDGVDKEAGIYVHHSVARLDKGIPNPKERPVVKLDWELEFNLTLMKNGEIDEQFLQTAFSKGGIAIGLGTFRGVFGKFIIDMWE